MTKARIQFGNNDPIEIEDIEITAEQSEHGQGFRFNGRADDSFEFEVSGEDRERIEKLMRRARVDEKVSFDTPPDAL